MKVHVKAETSTVRVFLDENQDYYNKDPYDTVMTIHHLGDDEVYISGLHGIVNRNILKKVFIELAEIGVKTVRFERNGKTRVHHL